MSSYKMLVQVISLPSCWRHTSSLCSET